MPREHCWPIFSFPGHNISGSGYFRQNLCRNSSHPRRGASRSPEASSGRLYPVQLLPDAGRYNFGPQGRAAAQFEKSKRNWCNLHEYGHDLWPRAPSHRVSPRTVGEAIRRHADLRPKQAAIVGSDFATVSYQALQDEIDGVRKSLRDAGLDRNARIAVAIANSAQATRAILAVTCAAAAVPIDPKLTVAEVERCLLILRPSALVVLGKSESAARTAAEQRGFPVIEASFSPGLKIDAPVSQPHHRTRSRTRTRPPSSCIPPAPRPIPIWFRTAIATWRP